MQPIKAIYPDGQTKEIVSLEEALSVYRHSTSHLMAAAVQELFPGTHLGIGPATDDGFYYDFETESPFHQEDLEKIEARMREICQRDLEIQPFLWDKQAAIEYFRGKGEHLKVELIEERAGDTLSCYRLGEMVDFCRGPHIARSGLLKHFKLLSNAAAYWKGDEKREPLQRIYGTGFFSQDDLQAYLNKLEEARKRDHRKLGKELQLFQIFDIAGPGFVYWMPKGTTLRYELESFTRQEHLRRGYQFVTIPHLARNTLFKTSGHYDFFRENMYVLDIEEEEYVIKPMNCPGHILIYKTGLHSYRDLPIRYAEFGTVYRYEKSGTLHGMLRVRGFTQDDAHIFCTPDQVYSEVLGVIDFAEFILKTFGFEDYRIELSVWDPARAENYAGTAENWQSAEDALRRALEEKGLNYTRKEGEAAFYGPKIDMKLIDAIGREWQATTIQFDFNLPERFDVTYIGPDSAKHRVIMIHRALFGSIERFTGVLLEHFAGAVPAWLSPVQVVLVPISERHHEYAKEVKDRLVSRGFRVQLDDRNEKMGYKIREAQMQKVPFMLVVGDKEASQGLVSVRNRFQGDEGQCSVEAFVLRLEQLVSSRAIQP
jgi:threonyl-tRNA synthetase